MGVGAAPPFICSFKYALEDLRLDGLDCYDPIFALFDACDAVCSLVDA
jgi:hypothetical protein